MSRARTAPAQVNLMMCVNSMVHGVKDSPTNFAISTSVHNVAMADIPMLVLSQLQVDSVSSSPRNHAE